MGGSFDPIHFAHLMVAEEAANTMELDEVLFIPNRQPPLPKHDVASAADRVEMVRLAIADNPRFRLSTIEIDRDGPSYSYDTVIAIREASPALDRLYFIVGADAIGTLQQWYRYEDMARVCEFIVTTRPGFDRDALLAHLPPALAKSIHALTVPSLEISSTAIRDRIARGMGIRYLTPDAVVGYIHKQCLYTTSGPEHNENSRSHPSSPRLDTFA